MAHRLGRKRRTSASGKLKIPGFATTAFPFLPVQDIDGTAREAEKRAASRRICLDTFLYRNVSCCRMARASTTSDAFNAVAEPRRREILLLLASRERPVGEIVVALRLSQPSVSKHLHVLRRTGLVRTRRSGRQILYRTNAQALRPLYEWTKFFERFWQHHLARVKERAESQARKQEKH